MFRSKDRWAVYAVENTRARLRHIDMGHRGRLEVEVTAGLTAGATVILHPTDRIVDGAAIVAR